MYLIDGALTGTTIQGQIGRRGYGNESVCNTSEIYRIGASPADAV